MTDKYNPPIYEKYNSPSDIRNDPALTHTEKMSILETWAEDARAMAEAASEGMTDQTGDAAPLLSEAEAALLEMKSGKT